MTAGMSNQREHHTDIHAFRALAELEVYEAGIDLFVSGLRDAEVRRSVAEHLRALRGCCAACPGLSVPWLALMISHFELLGRFDAPVQEQEDVERRALVARRHAGCIRDLASACRRELLDHRFAAIGRSIARDRRAARDKSDGAEARPST